jgi:hypothetical protein
MPLLVLLTRTELFIHTRKHFFGILNDWFTLLFQVNVRLLPVHRLLDGDRLVDVGDLEAPGGYQHTTEADAHQDEANPSIIHAVLLLYAFHGKQSVCIFVMYVSLSRVF